MTTILELVPEQMRRCGNKNGGEYHSQCPRCGHGPKSSPTTSDRFMVWPEQGEHGTFYCRGCDWGGDAIQYLIDVNNLTFPQACSQLGIEAGAQAAARSKPAAPVFTPRQVELPPALWCQRAAVLVSHCHNELLANVDQLDWLAERGIGLDLVSRFRLGWNSQDVWRPHTAWGLPGEKKTNGQYKKVWIPAGLIIPDFIDDQVVHVRIRRPNGEPRYIPITGSIHHPLTTNPGHAAQMVVESRLCAIMLAGQAGDLAGFIAMDSAQAKPPAGLFEKLKSSLHISVALDSDPFVRNPKTGKLQAAGPDASRWWLNNFDQAERTPVIGGKDPGDAYKAGFNVRTWVLATLAPRFQRKITSPAVAPQSPPADQPAEVAPDDDDPAALYGQTEGGRRYLVTASPEVWRQEVAAGRVVFSAGEVQRLSTAGAAPGDTELLMDIKEIFQGAYVSGGRPPEVV